MRHRPGMLTVAEETLFDLARQHNGAKVRTHLYGQEINGETYAICKADMLLKGEGEHADHIVGGPEWSTLSHDAFPAIEFDFMLSNPPYGKSWKKDLEAMGGKDGMRDPRFKVIHAGDAEFPLITRSSDGQMLFLANMASKMNHSTPLGSRIAEVHNGSSLFTGDAGQGESNIRLWIIENDWLEAILALPLNLFYNTGIATYIWLLTNRKPEHHAGKVQLIDATEWFKPQLQPTGYRAYTTPAAENPHRSRRNPPEAAIASRPRDRAPRWIDSDAAEPRPVRLYVCAQGSRAVEPDRRHSELAAGPPGRRSRTFHARKSEGCRRGRQLYRGDEPWAGSPSRAAGLHSTDPGNSRKASGRWARVSPDAGRATPNPKLDRPRRLLHSATRPSFRHRPTSCRRRSAISSVPARNGRSAAAADQDRTLPTPSSRPFIRSSTATAASAVS